MMSPWGAPAMIQGFGGGGGNRIGDNNCLCCGKIGHRKVDCPMLGKSCDICGKTDHLKSTCKAAGMSNNMTVIPMSLFAGGSFGGGKKGGGKGGCKWCAMG